MEKTWINAFSFIILLVATAVWAEPAPDTGHSKWNCSNGKIPYPFSNQPFYGQDGDFNINEIFYTGSGERLVDAVYKVDAFSPAIIEKQSVIPASPTPDVKVNGQDGQITVLAGISVSITASLATGDQNGYLADWWLAYSTPWGLYSLTSDGWVSGINLLAQYPLFSVSPVNIFNRSFPAGDYTFFFIVDMSPNGYFDSPYYYDFVQLHVVN